jgi:hypothetical protein
VVTEKLDVPLGINPIFFAAEFFDEFAGEYCFTPVVPANRVLSQRAEFFLPPVRADGVTLLFFFSAGL